MSGIFSKHARDFFSVFQGFSQNMLKRYLACLKKIPGIFLSYSKIPSVFEKDTRDFLDPIKRYLACLKKIPGIFLSYSKIPSMF